MNRCVESPPKADEIVQLAIKAHGWENVENKKIDFDFRKHHYQMTVKNGDFTYFRIAKDSLGNVTKDVVVNSSSFQRFENEKEVEVEDEWQKKYLNSVNSVLYFFQLPFRLNDPAVIKSYLGTTNIGGKPFHQLKITFKQEDGGEDFEDEYMYWIGKDDYILEYLAYNYQTEGGGTRFRTAINRRNVNGFLIQDYINLKPKKKFVALDSLPILFEKNQLLELSKIINENVKIEKLP